VERGPGTVAVTTTAGRVLSARVLVAADGAGSRIRRELTAGDPRTPARPLRLVKLEIPAPRDFGEQMIYDFSPMADGLRGYVWLFPVAGGRLNVGAMHTTTRALEGGEVQSLLARTLARHGVELPRTARGWPAWPYAPRGRVSAPHVLCVGDAAGIDALTGEGIAVGLEHGPIAAAAIDHALESGDFSFTGYAAAVRRAIVGRELALDDRLARLLYAREGFRFWLSLVLFDARVRSMYAARVCGSSVLSDRALSLWGALARHVVAAPLRLRRMARAVPSAGAQLGV
jgi:flavin-dependent dehydrogenase